MPARAQLRAFQGCARAALLSAAVFAAGPPARADSLSHLTVGANAPDFLVLGADGRRHSLHEYKGKIVVLEWTSPVCPFTAVKYGNGSMQALQAFAVEHRVVWLSIDTAAKDRAGYLSPAAARKRLRDTHATVTAFLFDTDTQLARRYGAKTTPSFFIVDASGKLVYQGAMDAENAAPQDPNFVHEALDALLNGQAVKVTETAQRGCAVEY